MRLPYVNETLFFLCLLFASACEQAPEHHAQSKGITKTYIDQHNGYSEAVVITSADHRTIYVSGQIGDGPDLESQMRSAIGRLKALLDKMDASTGDIVKMNTFIVGYEEAQLDLFRDLRKELLGDEKMPASTLVGVQALARKEWLIEIEAIAVVPLNTDK